jgi:hypothetical protein
MRVPLTADIRPDLGGVFERTDESTKVERDPAIAPAVAVTMESDEPGRRALARQWQVGGRSDNLGVPARNAGKGD